MAKPNIEFMDWSDRRPLSRHTLRAPRRHLHMGKRKPFRPVRAEGVLRRLSEADARHPLV